MKTKQIGILMLFACLGRAADAASDWVRLGENARAEIFMDAAGLERPPGHIKAWTLLSFKSRQRGGWQSERRLFMFGCKDRKLAWQQSVYYAEPMAGGEFVHSRSLNRFGVTDLRLAELDPSTRDAAQYREAVPESEFISVFKNLC